MAFVMGIVTMIKVTRNMPRKLTNGTADSSPDYCDQREVKPVSNADHMAVIKCVAELEEKVSVLSMNPAMTPEKEEMLNAELAATTKALDDSLGRQEEVVAYLEKKKKKKKMFNW